MMFYGATTFCEDIRRESGGSLTLVGVRRKALIVDAWPFTLPKFCFSIACSAPLEDDERLRDMEFQIFFPGDGPLEPSLRLSPEGGSHPAVRDPLLAKWYDLQLDGPRRVQITMDMEIGGFVVKEEGKIRVRGLLKSGETLHLGGLLVVHRDSVPKGRNPDSGRST